MYLTTVDGRVSTAISNTSLYSICCICGVKHWEMNNNGKMVK